MEQTRGGLVVLAWDLLNDLRLKTNPVSDYQEIHREIRRARATHHTVLVVNPPATTATFTINSASEPALWSGIVPCAAFTVLTSALPIS